MEINPLEGESCLVKHLPPWKPLCDFYVNQKQANSVGSEGSEDSSEGILNLEIQDSHLCLSQVSGSYPFLKNPNLGIGTLLGLRIQPFLELCYSYN